ncbi:MAG: serine protein kinase RIO [Euryarchaeota archaeon]|nr:serine protein kinase RIO [Euryarchaeota archaeon]
MQSRVLDFLETRVDALKHRDKDQDEMRRTGSEIFDERTLMVLYKLLSTGVFDTLEFPISTGKEANIFRGTKGDRFVAVKIYRVATATFKSFGKYIIGDPRFRSIGRDHRGLIGLWAQKEYKNLLRLGEAGVRVPEPITCREHVLVMEYIGQPDAAAPMLRDAGLDRAGLERVRHEVLAFFDRSHNRAGLVHGDLSEYNILVDRGRTVFIDLAQAVVLEHPMAAELLVRDLHNMAAWFGRKGLPFDWKVVHNQVLSRSRRLVSDRSKARRRTRRAGRRCEEEE